MFTVELYARIRRAVMVDGLSRREAATRSLTPGKCRISPNADRRSAAHNRNEGRPDDPVRPRGETS